MINPEECSFGYDEPTYHYSERTTDSDYEPELNIVVNTKDDVLKDSSDDAVRIKGKITISF